MTDSTKLSPSRSTEAQIILRENGVFFTLTTSTTPEEHRLYSQAIRAMDAAQQFRASGDDGTTNEQERLLVEALIGFNDPLFSHHVVCACRTMFDDYFANRVNRLLPDHLKQGAERKAEKTMRWHRAW